MSYRDAGVDIDAGDELVERIKPYAKRTMRPEVLAGIGGFGALCRIPAGYREPVLVSGTDGVGTKLRLAFELDRHDTVGIDLVAMSVNDILVQGAEPLFFLDYFACGKLDVATAAAVVKGVAAGCEQAGCRSAGRKQQPCRNCSYSVHKDFFHGCYSLPPITIEDLARAGGEALIRVKAIEKSFCVFR